MINTRITPPALTADIKVPSFESGRSTRAKSDAFSQFGELLANGVKDVNSSVNEYEEISKKFAQGEKVNVNEMMVKGEQADLSLRMMVAMRDKIVEAYQEIMRLPV